MFAIKTGSVSIRESRDGALRLIEYYRCGNELPSLSSANLKRPSGYFRFDDVICYGQSLAGVSPTPNGRLTDVSKHIVVNDSGAILPFDVSQIVDNLRFESYVRSNRRLLEKTWIKNLYYWLRPVFPVAFRRHLQKLYLSDWESIPFPAWPLDRTVDRLFEKLLVLSMKELAIDRIPFIWFWPEGRPACAVMTHDVETAAGRDYCDALMDIDDHYGIKASFQVVPEKRYAVSSAYLQGIRDRGFEVNVQGLDHDGDLFQNRQVFLERARKINQYAAEYDALGFRSPILYRNTSWLQDLNFSYDMSVPNVARLEAQRGGCCTILPYFLPGGMTELPVTMIEDYTLFNILKVYTIDLWQQQMNTIMDGNGIMNFIIHPDYVESGRPRQTYEELLSEVARLRSDRDLWVCLPRDVDRWWRARAEMSLVPAADGGWCIEGEGSDRARIAYAHREGDRVVYEIAADGDRA
jgi:hypothetical protein